MLTKLPFLIAAATNPRGPVPMPPNPAIKPPAFSKTALMANGSGGADASKNEPLKSIWKEASASQRSMMTGQSAKEIMASGAVTGEALEELATDIMLRAEEAVPDTRAILVSIGGSGSEYDETADEFAIGPLAKAFIMDRYEQKYDITIGSVMLKGEVPQIDPEKLDKIVDTLESGKQAAVITVDGSLSHSATLILKLEPETKTLHAVDMDGIVIDRREAEPMKKAALAPIAERTGTEIEFKRGAKLSRQDDASSCNTEACIIARSMLRDQDSNFAVDFQEGDEVPMPTMKTAQRDRYLSKNNYNPDTVYSEAKNRTLGQHRDDFTTNIDGTDKFMYLKAKSLQMANMTLNWLESLDDDTREDVYDRMMDKAYPGFEPHTEDFQM